MSDQLVLSLSDDPRQGAARRRDRQTSRDAAESMRGDALRDQQRKVLQLVAGSPHGATAYEVHTQEPAIQQNVASKRLGELLDMRLVERRYGWINGERVYQTRPGSSGRKCEVFFLSETGRERLRGVVEVEVGSWL